MSLDNAPFLPKPKRKIGCLGIAGIVILAIVLIFVIAGIYSSVQRQQWAANSGSRTVAVTGDLSGEGWSIADTGELKSNAQYSEMSFLVHVSRVGDTSRNTPTFTAIVGDDNGGENTCETFRSYIWSTEEGSDMEVSCDYYLTLDELKKVLTVEITSAN
ncbi:hypothetical protein [Glaciihabitans sp. UYNi722]|uniref:hypothetical protein n=1 Tax=Glaciihabitans sp. UYNi722 TaxID=3156344 RepID=UPI00339A6665